MRKKTLVISFLVAVMLSPTLLCATWRGAWYVRGSMEAGSPMFGMSESSPNAHLRLISGEPKYPLLLDFFGLLLPGKESVTFTFPCGHVTTIENRKGILVVAVNGKTFTADAIRVGHTYLVFCVPEEDEGWETANVRLLKVTPKGQLRLSLITFRGW